MTITPLIVQGFLLSKLHSIVPEFFQTAPNWQFSTPDMAEISFIPTAEQKTKLA